MMRKRPAIYAKQQHGMAVILALFVVMLASFMVTQLLWQQNNLMATVSQQSILTQASALQNTSVAWAERILREDARVSTNDDLTEPWAQPLAETPISDALGQALKEDIKNSGLPEAFIAGVITDAQARFNLRNLVAAPFPNKSEFGKFKKLLRNLNMNDAVAKKLRDHFYPGFPEDTDDNASQQTQPKLIDVKPFLNIYDLQKVIGDDNFKKLEPYVVWLPEPTPVNANTTTAEVLSACIDNLDLATAKRLLGERKIGSFKDIADVANRIAGLNLSVLPNNISTATNYFFVEGRLKFQQTNVVYWSFIHRSPDGKTTVFNQRQR